MVCGLYHFPLSKASSNRTSLRIMAFRVSRLLNYVEQLPFTSWAFCSLGSVSSALPGTYYSLLGFFFSFFDIEEYINILHPPSSIIHPPSFLLLFPFYILNTFHLTYCYPFGAILPFFSSAFCTRSPLTTQFSLSHWSITAIRYYFWCSRPTLKHTYTAVCLHGLL